MTIFLADLACGDLAVEPLREESDRTCNWHNVTSRWGTLMGGRHAFIGHGDLAKPPRGLVGVGVRLMFSPTGWQLTSTAVDAPYASSPTSRCDIHTEGRRASMIRSCGPTLVVLVGDVTPALSARLFKHRRLHEDAAGCVICVSDRRRSPSERRHRFL